MSTLYLSLKTTEQVHLKFLQSTLKLCKTFVDLAKTELLLGHREAALRILNKAKSRCSTVTRILPEVKNLEYKNEIENSLNDLQAGIGSIQIQLHS